MEDLKKMNEKWEEILFENQKKAFFELNRSGQVFDLRHRRFQKFLSGEAPGAELLQENLKSPRNMAQNDLCERKQCFHENSNFWNSVIFSLKLFWS